MNSIVKGIVACLFGLSMFGSVSGEKVYSCPECSDVYACLESIASKMQVCYAFFSNYDKVDNFLKVSENLDELHRLHELLCSDLDDICRTIMKCRFFDLTPHRSCKWGTPEFLRESKSLVVLLEDIFKVVTELSAFDPFANRGDRFLDIKENSFQECMEFSNVLKKFFPPTSWEFSLMNLCDRLTESLFSKPKTPSEALSSDSVRNGSENLFKDHENYARFFSEQSSFYRKMNKSLLALSIAFEDLSKSDDLHKRGLCQTCTDQGSEKEISNVLRILSSSFSLSSDPLEKAFYLVEQNKIFQLQNLLESTLDAVQRLPLMTQDGRKVGFIPEDETHTMFVFEENGTIQMPVYKEVWDYKEAKRVPVCQYMLVTLDENERIESPYPFVGMPCPVPAYITFGELYKAMKENSDKSWSLMEKIYNQVKENTIYRGTVKNDF